MEDKNKKVTAINTSSEIQEKKELTDIELLDQILNKKKNITRKTTGSNRKKVSKKKKIVSKNNDLSSDELLEQILTKKKKNQKSKKNAIDEKIIEDKSEDVVLKEKEVVISEDIIKDKISNDTIDKDYNIIEKNEKSVINQKYEKLSDKDNNNKENTIDKLHISEKQEKQDLSQDLIITRSITFDSDVNLKNKKTLKELRKAIEEFDRIETLTEISLSSEKINANKLEKKDDKKNATDLFKTSTIVLDTRSERYLKSSKGFKNDNKKHNVDKDTYHLVLSENSLDKNNDLALLDRFEKKNFLAILICVFLIMLLFVILIFYFAFRQEESDDFVSPPVIDVMDQINENDFLETDYQNCLSAPVDDTDFTIEMNTKIEALNTYIKENYKTSILYEDLNLGYTYKYNAEEVYYAASTIKSLVALYMYREADAERLSLDDTITYTRKYKVEASKGMNNHKYGDKVTLRDLVKYSVIYSDNSAHQMLVDYIGRDKLIEYGTFLGAKHTLYGGDNFGHIDVNDAIIYMKAVYNFINKGSSLSLELKSFFIAAEQNDLALPDLNIEAAHKYGSYSVYYHDIGIVYDKNPYVIAILTTEGKGDYESKVKDINRHVYTLHQAFYENREKICKEKFYGN